MERRFFLEEMTLLSFLLPTVIILWFFDSRHGATESFILIVLLQFIFTLLTLNDTVTYVNLQYNYLHY